MLFAAVVIGALRVKPANNAVFACRHLRSKIKVYGKGLCFFSNVFSKGDMRNEDLPEGINSNRKEFAPTGTNSFLYELTHNEVVGKYGSGMVAFPECISIYCYILCANQDCSFLPTGLIQSNFSTDLRMCSKQQW